MPRSLVHPRPAAGRRSLGSLAWLFALLLPALAVAGAILSEIELGVDVQRLLLLLVVALAGVLLGSRPAILSALVATLLAGYDAVGRRWIVVRPADLIVLGVFAVTAVGVALAAGARRGAAISARDLKKQLAHAERTGSEHSETAERLATDVAALRAAAARRDRELVAARDAAARAERARKELLDSLPDELRAPHIHPPAALQLFPPIFTRPPIGVP